MSNRYSRKENETTMDYLLRLAEIKFEEKPSDLEFADIASYCGFNCHYDSLRKALQPSEYGGYAIFKYLKEKYEKQEINEDSLLKEYELKKQELQKEKIKIQTEKITLNQLLREQARFELFTERAEQAIKELKPLPIPEKITKNDTNIEGLLCIADCHFGKEILIKGLKGEILNQYNEEIFENRMYKLLYKIVDICKKENLTSINIMNLGDELDGLIHLNQLVSLKYGVVESAVKFSYFIATWLNNLSQYVNIKYYSTSGNHTDLRLLGSKKGELPNENISKMVFTLTKEILKNNNNVECVNNDTDMIYTKISGFNVLGIHGEEKDVQQAIRDYSYMYNENIQYIVTGHKHHSNSINLGLSKGTIGVGSICGLDDYSLKLKKISEPSSTFVIFENGIGKTIEYNIALQ